MCVYYDQEQSIQKKVATTTVINSIMPKMIGIMLVIRLRLVRI